MSEEQEVEEVKRNVSRYMNFWWTILRVSIETDLHLVLSSPPYLTWHRPPF
jgi:hypothetical protein